MKTKIEHFQAEVENLKEKEKEQRVASMEAKNELFVAEKNAEIEIDALRSQLTLKEQQFDQNEKEHNKAKIKFEK